MASIWPILNIVGLMLGLLRQPNRAYFDWKRYASYLDNNSIKR